MEIQNYDVRANYQNIPVQSLQNADIKEEKKEEPLPPEPGNSIQGQIVDVWA